MTIEEILSEYIGRLKAMNPEDKEEIWYTIMRAYFKVTEYEDATVDELIALAYHPEADFSAMAIMMLGILRYFNRFGADHVADQDVIQEVIIAVGNAAKMSHETEISAYNRITFVTNCAMKERNAMVHVTEHMTRLCGEWGVRDLPFNEYMQYFYTAAGVCIVSGWK